MTQIDCETALAYLAAGQKDKAMEIFKRLVRTEIPRR